MEQQELLFVLTQGPEDPDRARFALNAALVAASSGLAVTLYLALRAAHWACAAHDGDSHHAELRDLVDQVRAAGGVVECCSACLERHCALPGARHEQPSQLENGVRMSGLASLVRRASTGAQTITF